MNEDTPWPKQLIASIGALLAAGLIVGAVAGVLIVKAANVAGVGGSAGGAQQGPLMVDPTTVAPGPTGQGPKSPKSSGKPTNSAGTKSGNHGAHKHQQRPIHLLASKSTASPMEQVTLSGSYPGKDGVSLQVQSKSGGAGWSDFPVTTSVNGGIFSTYIQTGITGKNKFRMVDTSTGTKSNVVTVTIR